MQHVKKWAVKQIDSESGKSVQMVIKLSQGSEATEKNNSIITAYTIRHATEKWIH